MEKSVKVTEAREKTGFLYEHEEGADLVDYNVRQHSRIIHFQVVSEHPGESGRAGKLLIANS